jgi:hypothetical protein
VPGAAQVVLHRHLRRFAVGLTVERLSPDRFGWSTRFNQDSINARSKPVRQMGGPRRAWDSSTGSSLHCLRALSTRPRGLTSCLLQPPQTTQHLRRCTFCRWVSRSCTSEECGQTALPSVMAQRHPRQMQELNEEEGNTRYC